MKLIGALLVTIGLIAGAFTAASAYVVRLDAIDPADRLTLHAPAGADPADPAEPLLRPGTLDEPRVLTAEDLAALERARGELDDPAAERRARYVHVKEFSWSRWRGRWWFLLSCVALVAGAAFLRIGAREELARLRAEAEVAAGTATSTATAMGPAPGISARVTSEAAAPPPPPTAPPAGPDDDVAFAEVVPVGPQRLLHDAVAEVAALLEAARSTPTGQERRHLILDGLDRIRERRLEPFVAARPQIINMLGMAGFAQIMDRFAAAERQLNRAWSAAADGVEHESIVSLGRGLEILKEASARMQ